VRSCQPPRGRVERACRWLAALAALLVPAIAAAQPYAAGGGFDRPREAFALTRPALAAVVDAGRPRLAIADAGGLRLIDLVPGGGLDEGAASWLAEGAVVRGVAAASGWGADGAAAYAWYERDPVSGRYRYWWHWGEERRPLLEAAQELDLALFVGPSGPAAYLAVPSADGARLERHPWEARGSAEVVVRSEQGLAAPTVARDADGEPHLAFLEGATVDTALGRSAQWRAVYVAPDGGERHVDGARPPPTQLVLDVRESGVLLWRRADGRLMASGLRGTASDAANGHAGTRDADGGPGPRDRLGSDAIAAPAAVLGVGRAIGVVGERAFWASGASIVASRLPAPGGPVPPPVNVAWSPYAIEQAALVAHEDVTFLSWAGSLPGGGTRALTSDDATAFRPGWRDHLAARFGWTPWALGEQAVGQLAGALLVGVLGTMALLPPLWLLGLLLARRVPERWARRAGAVVAVGVVALLGVVAATRAASLGHDPAALLGDWWGFALALAAGAWLPPTLLRRADLEPQPALLVGAALGSFVSLSVAAFLAFEPWLEVLGV
jgi:hypothetical protein